MQGSSRSAASGRVGSIGCHSRHGPGRSRSRPSASQQARVLPVEDPPTSTTIPLRPSAAACTTEPSAVSCSRGTYGGSTGSPGGGSSGCTGRCTSSENGSVTSDSSRPGGAPGAGTRSSVLETLYLLAFRMGTHASHTTGTPILTAAKPKITAAAVPTSRWRRRSHKSHRTRAMTQGSTINHTAVAPSWRTGCRVAASHSRQSRRLAWFMSADCHTSPGCGRSPERPT